MLLALREAYGSVPAVRRQYALRRKDSPCPHGRKAPCIHGRPACGFVAQSWLTLAPPAVKGAYFFLSTENLNNADEKGKGSVTVRNHADDTFSHIAFPQHSAEPSGPAGCPQVHAATSETIFPPRGQGSGCLLYTSPSPRDAHESRMPSSA